jgi:hypothetical protein
MPKKRAPAKKKPIKKRLDVVQKEWAEQTDVEKADTTEKCLIAFREMGLKSVEVVVAKETQYPQAFAVEHFAAVGACTEAQGRELEKYSNLLEVFDKFEVEVSSVVVGSKLPFLVSAFDLDMKETTLLEDRRGSILVIQYWTPGNKSCEEALTALTALSVKHAADWAGKVQLLTMCCEASVEDAKAAIAANNWTEGGILSHLLAGEGAEEDADNIVNKYEIETLPDLMLVDGEGRLMQRADPEDINVEELVEKLLAGETELTVTPAVPEGGWQSLADDKRAELLAKVCEVLSSDPNLSDVLLVTTQATINSVVGGPPRTEMDLMLVGKVDIRAESKVKDVVAVLAAGGVTDVDKTVIVTSPETALVCAEACRDCEKKFADMDQKALVRWHCAMCVDSYTICEACEPTRKHPKFHPLFRVGPSVEKEDLDRAQFSIGSFAVCMHGEEAHEAEGGCKEVVHEDVYCNGCKEGPIADGARWKCCSCEDFDFCSACYDLFLQQSEGSAPGKIAVTCSTGSGGSSCKDTSCKDAGCGTVAKKEKKGKKAAPGQHQKNHFFMRIEDSEMVQIAESDDEGEGDGEGDEGDMFDEFDDEEMNMLAQAMQDPDNQDTDAIMAKLQALRASGKLEGESDEEDDEDGPTLEDADTEKVLVRMTQEALQVPLPDDDF